MNHEDKPTPVKDLTIFGLTLYESPMAPGDGFVIHPRRLEQVLARWNEIPHLVEDAEGRN